MSDRFVEIQEDLAGIIVAGLLPRLGAKRGICRVCACTDDFACEGGCAWIDADHTLCSRCCPPLARGRRAARKRGR